jgi:hypothetical protein
MKNDTTNSPNADTASAVLTDNQIDYAISQVVDRARSGPYSGLIVLANHLATVDRDTARRDADKLIAALANDQAEVPADFEEAQRVQFSDDMKLDTGCTA